MTEADWRNDTDPASMLNFVSGRANSRRLRLFAVACCRQVLPAFEHWELVDGVKQIEAVADGVTDPTTLIGVAHRAEAHL